MLNIEGPFLVNRGLDFMSEGLTDFEPVSLKIHLFKNDIVPSPATLLTDFVEADFDGYAAVAVLAVDYPGFYIMPDGSVLGIFPKNILFEDTGNVTPNTIFGVYITNTGSTALLASIRFDTSKLMDDDGKFIYIELALRMPVGAPDAQADVTSNG